MQYTDVVDLYGNEVRYNNVIPIICGFNNYNIISFAMTAF